MAFDSPINAHSAPGQAVCLERSTASERTEVNADRASSTLYAAVDQANPVNRSPEFKRDLAGGILPDCQIVDGVNPGRSAAELLNEQTARDLHAALTRRDNLGRPNPDIESFKIMMNSVTGANSSAVEAAYQNVPGNGQHRDLRNDLALLPPSDQILITARLNRTDDSTNDAGNLMDALTAIRSNRSGGERRVIETFATLNSDSMSVLEFKFQADYGVDITTALKNFGVSSDTMRILEVMRKPVNERTAADLQGLAEFAVSRKNLDVLSLALRGDTPPAKQARAALQSDSEFMTRVVDAFRGPGSAGVLAKLLLAGTANGAAFLGMDLLKSIGASKNDARLSVALDIVSEGHPSIATIARNNTGSLFGMFDNPKNIGIAVDSATDAERRTFALGHELVTARREPANPEEKAARDFYNRTVKAFETIGDKRQQLQLEARMLFGKDSLEAKVLSGESMNARISALESVSREDWHRFSDTQNGAQARQQFIDLLSRFAGRHEVSRFKELLDGKAEAKSFEESQKVKRTLSEVVRHGTDSGWLSTTYDTQGITNAIANMSLADAQRYSTDSENRRTIDTFVQQILDVPTRRYLQSLLTQVESTGKPAPKGAAEKVLANEMNNVEGRDALLDIEKLLRGDPALRERLRNDSASLNPLDRALRETIIEVTNRALLAAFGSQYRNGREIASAERSAFFENIWQNGSLPLNLKAQMGLKNEAFYQAAAVASPTERASLFLGGNISREERNLIEIAAAQGGTLRLEDRIRAFLLNDSLDYADFKRDFQSLSPESRQQFKENFLTKYGTTVDNVFLARIEAKDRPEFARLLSNGSTDGRQEFYDNLQTALRSRSGLVPDGSGFTLDRVVNGQAAALQEFSNRFEALPQDVKVRANQLFREALEDYRNSKEQYAEKLYQAAVLVGGVSTAIVSGGVAIPALVAVATLSAAGRVALKRGLQGDDYDLSLGNILRDGSIGALTGGFSVLGPETLLAIKGIGAATASNVIARSLEGSLIGNAESIIAREINTLAGQAMLSGQSVTREALEAMASRLTVPGAAPSIVAENIQLSLKEAGIRVSEQIIRTNFARVTATAEELFKVGLFGGTTNALTESTVGLTGGNFDVSKLPESFLTGFAAGGTLAGLFKGFSSSANALRKAFETAPIPFDHYQPEIFRAASYEVPVGMNKKTIFQDTSITATQSLDEGGRLPINVSASLETGRISGTFGHKAFEDLLQGMHVPHRGLADGFEVRINGEVVPLELSRGVLPEQEYLKWSAPSTNGTSTIELSFHGRRIGLYSFDQSAQTLIRLEAPRSISVFDIREFHVDPNYGIEFARSGFTINPMAPPANQIDLHTHFGGTMRAETIINVAGEVGSPMPVEYLDRYHIRYLDHAVETVGTRQVVRLRPENFGQGELDKLMSRMSIPEGNRIIFPGMEAIYDLRNQVTKDVNAFPLYLKHIAQEYKQQGVKYAELSISDILDPAWLAKAKEVLPDIERETGVKLRFVAGIWRLGEPGYIADRVRRVMELKNEPYIVGVDFMGEELNSTRVFANEIKQLAEFRRTQRPDFQIRVHAGENQNELENVKEAIRLGATRIGHGLFGVDEETIRLARKHNVIIELQTNSNLALSNINSKNIVPVKQYLDAGVRVSLGTDGYGMYQTSARSEQAVMLSLGLTHADFFKIKESDRLYLKTMEAAERRLIRRNPARSASEQAQPIAEQ